MALRARKASPCLLSTLNPQSTCHGPRPGPTLAPHCSGGLPAFPGAESTRKDPRPEEKEMPMCKKTYRHSNIGGGYVMGGEAWHTVFKVASIYVSLACT